MNKKRNNFKLWQFLPYNSFLYFSMEGKQKTRNIPPFYCRYKVNNLIVRHVVQSRGRHYGSSGDDTYCTTLCSRSVIYPACSSSFAAIDSTYGSITPSCKALCTVLHTCVQYSTVLVWCKAGLALSESTFNVTTSPSATFNVTATQNATFNVTTTQNATFNVTTTHGATFNATTSHNDTFVLTWHWMSRKTFDMR